MKECPSRFTLVRFYKEDISQSEIKGLKEHIDSCDRCAGNIDEIRHNEVSYGEKIESHASRLREALENEPIPIRPGKSTLISVTAIAVAAAVLLGFYVTPLFTNSGTKDDQIAYKGSFAVQVVASRKGSQFKVVNGTSLTADDSLMFTITASSAGYLFAICVDARNNISILYPAPSGTSENGLMAIDRKGDTILPGSIVLDGSTGSEHLVVVFAEESFDTDAVKENIDDILKGITPAPLKNAIIEVIGIEKN